MSDVWMNCIIEPICTNFTEELKERVFGDIPTASDGKRSLTVLHDSRAHNLVLFHADFIPTDGPYLTKSVALDVRQLADFQWDSWSVEQAANGLANIEWRESSLYHQDLIELVDLQKNQRVRT